MLLRTLVVYVAVLSTLTAASHAGGLANARDLTFGERVKAQKAIEEVYWRHRIWPKDNPGPKPPLEAVMPESSLRAKVEDYLLKSDALDKDWGHALTAVELQAELNRMAAKTRAGSVLQELFDALDNDPALIAETLVRQNLAEREVRHRYATARPENSATSFERWWHDRRRGLTTSIPPAKDIFPAVMPDVTTCTNDSWSTVDASAPDPRTQHTAVWTGSEMIVWGGHELKYMSTGGRYDPATDTWTATPTGPDAPTARGLHSAVWTGTEMVIWGGRSDAQAYFNTGGRYDPLTNAWRPMSTTNAPVPRTDAAMFWTGSVVIVWGGMTCCSTVNTGGRYDPVTDTWSPTNAGASAPSKRQHFTAVWTGSELIVWGGHNGSPSQPLQTGRRYDPVTDTWSPTSTGANVPAARYSHAAVWTGSEMIIWGGAVTPGWSSTGARYDPVADSWTPTSTDANVPTGRSEETSIWTGHEMVIWGGYSSGVGYVNTGARYDPSLNAWSPVSTGDSVPTPREKHTAVWTGDEMIVWGGNTGTSMGGRYRPDTDTWSPTSLGDGPTARSSHVAVWTGAELVVWGGVGRYEGPFNNGGLYDPALDTWRPTSVGLGVPDPRTDASAVWTGAEIIVWGGWIGNIDLQTGGRYNPLTDTWRPTNADAGVPAARHGHVAVWTGREMIVWGPGRNGGRYDPSTDTWAPVNSGPTSPTAKFGRTGVFLGGRMIVWGGDNTGGRYDPSTDTWMPTSTGPGVPLPRTGHTAVAAGDKMIIFGGSTSGVASSGAVYDPQADSWTPTGIPENLSSRRYDHMAVWTGTEMIVWGGRDTYGGEISGGRYDPATDGWTSTSEGPNVPIPRRYPKGVWTGTEMIVWGGDDPVTANGGRYCACPNGRLVYRDADGDGYGDPGNSLPSSDGSVPAGFVLDHTDCNDGNASAHPGAVEICDGIDNDCNGLVDESPSAEDADADEVHDLCDNCPYTFNPSQSDFDHDGEGDACDLNDDLIYERRDDKTSVSWQAEQGPTSWNLYIGDLDVLKVTGVYTQVPGSNPLAQRQCGVSATMVDDPAVPDVGKVSFSLVTGVTAGVEGSLGSSSAGPRSNQNPCP